MEKVTSDGQTSYLYLTEAETNIVHTLKVMQRHPESELTLGQIFVKWSEEG